MERCGTQSLEMKCLTPLEGVRTLALTPYQDILLYVLHRNRNEQPWMIFPTRTQPRQRETKYLFLNDNILVDFSSIVTFAKNGRYKCHRNPWHRTQLAHQ